MIIDENSKLKNVNKKEEEDKKGVVCKSALIYKFIFNIININNILNIKSLRMMIMQRKFFKKY